MYAVTTPRRNGVSGGGVGSVGGASLRRTTPRRSLVRISTTALAGIQSCPAVRYQISPSTTVSPRMERYVPGKRMREIRPPPGETYVRALGHTGRAYRKGNHAGRSVRNAAISSRAMRAAGGRLSGISMAGGSSGVSSCAGNSSTVTDVSAKVATQNPCSSTTSTVMRYVPGLLYARVHSADCSSPSAG